MPKVVFVNEKKEIEVPQGANLRTEARKAGIEIYQGKDRILNCRGLGLCGTCRALVKSGMEHLNPKTYMEKVNVKLHQLPSFAYIGHEDEMRLTCQAQVNDDCAVVTQSPTN